MEKSQARVPCFDWVLLGSGGAWPDRRAANDSDAFVSPVRKEEMMSTHRYARAYMAGVAVPTRFLLVILTGFVFLRLILRIPVPLEKIIVFPMAVVPNVFGLWNMLYVKLQESRQVSIGDFGALLPFVLAPIGGAVACSLGFLTATSSGLEYFGTVRANDGLLAAGFGVVIVIYCLSWKYLVNFFNGVVGIA
jgi:hypothetical protein